jgi:hypothetical protein
MTLGERFWKRVDRTGDCWEWQGQLSEKGYGQLQVQGKQKRAHRVSWELSNGPIPDGMVIMHRCDNPKCVRPEHLSVGTVADNNRDMQRKGRARFALLPGQRNGAAKLSDEQARQVSANRGQATAQELVNMFGVSAATVYAIWRGSRWGLPARPWRALDANTVHKVRASSESLSSLARRLGVSRHVIVYVKQGGYADV